MRKISLLLLFIISFSSHVYGKDSRKLANRAPSSYLDCITHFLPSVPEFRAAVSRRIKKYYLDPSLGNFENTHLLLRPKNNLNKSLELSVGKRIANGFNGTVYHVDDLKGAPSNFDLHSNWIVKMSNRSKKEKLIGGVGKNDNSLLKEFEIEDFFEKKVDDLWSSGELDNKSEKWVTGKLPISLTKVMIDSTDGVYLIKPLIKGKSLGDIYSEFGTKNIPVEMKESLRDVFELGQIINRKIVVPAKIDKSGTAMPFSLDLKPENLMWVDDVGSMKSFGLKKPGFVFVEFTHYSSNKWVYAESKTSFDNYYQLFLDYVKASK
jgi:hypothetical protein